MTSGPRPAGDGWWCCGLRRVGLRASGRFRTNDTTMPAMMMRASRAPPPAAAMVIRSMPVPECGGGVEGEGDTAGNSNALGMLSTVKFTGGATETLPEAYPTAARVLYNPEEEADTNAGDLTASVAAVPTVAGSTTMYLICRDVTAVILTRATVAPPVTPTGTPSPCRADDTKGTDCSLAPVDKNPHREGSPPAMFTPKEKVTRVSVGPETARAEGMHCPLVAHLRPSPQSRSWVHWRPLEHGGHLGPNRDPPPQSQSVSLPSRTPL